MKANERILRRLRKDRPMTTISIRVPEDVIEDLKRVAPELGFSGYQPLIRAYVGQGLRKDLARLERDSAEALTASLGAGELRTRLFKRLLLRRVWRVSGS